MRLPEHVHVLHVPIPNNPLGFLLAYLLPGKNGHTIIDTGWDAPEAYDSLLAQIGKLGYSVKDIRQIILTHMHPDHSGLANQIRRESGARVLAHTNEVPPPDHWFSGAGSSEIGALQSPFDTFGIPRDVYENTRFASGQFRNTLRTLADELLNGGEILDAGETKLEVIWTPGHARGHICLYDREHRVLFVGDHVLPVTTPNVNLLWANPDLFDPLGDYLSSLEKLRALEVDIAFPAHDHIFDDFVGRLDELARHHEARLHEMCTAAEGTWVTPFEVAQKIRWTVGDFDSLADTHKILASGETLAHLEFLHRREQLEKKNEDGLLLFRK